MGRTIRNLEKTLIGSAGEPSTVACGVSQHQLGDVIRRPAIPLVTAALLERGTISYQLAEGPPCEVVAPVLLAVDPGTAFTGVVRTPSRDTWVILPERPQWRTLLAEWPERGPGLRVVPLLGDALGMSIREGMAAMVAAHVSAHPERQALTLNAWERVVLLARALVPAGRRLPPALAAALAYAAARPLHPHRVASLARAVGCSSSHLAALARTSLQESLMRHLRHRQLERGRDLLLGTAWPIARVAAAVGFPDPFHFSHRFRARYGCSPRAYRQGIAR